MLSKLRYGLDSTLELDVEPGALLADCVEPRGAALNDAIAATAAVLAEPLNFPPLRQAVVPGDRVVLALESGVPQAPALVAAVVSAVLEAGAAAADICILHPPGDPAHIADDLRSALPIECREQVEILAHDPSHRDQLSYLAANEAGDPIYVNRRLFDADVVLPIGCARLESTPGYYGINATLYPTFADPPALERFRATEVEPTADEIAARRQEANDVAWQVGVLLTIQVVPAAGGRLLHVIAGTPLSVEERANELCSAAWKYEVPRRAELVVAAIEGGDDQQTWENVGRAVAAASRAVADDGAIALCTDLAVEPGPALEWIGRARDLTDAMRHIREHPTNDAAAARQLAGALQRGRIYLLSRLEDSVVEELGMAPVSAAADIARLARRHGSCILLGNAQYAQPTPVGEIADTQLA